MGDHVGGVAFWLDQRHQILEGNALPGVVQPAPGRDAMHVSRDRRRRQPADFVPGQRRRRVDLAVEAQPPLRHVIARRTAIGEHRPFLREHLAGRQSMRVLDHAWIRLAIAPKEHQLPPGPSPPEEGSSVDGCFSSFRNWSKASTTTSLTPYTLKTRSNAPCTSASGSRSVCTSYQGTSVPSGVFHVPSS